MPFDDYGMVQRLKNAVDSLVGTGTIQERLESAYLSLIPLRLEDFPSEQRERFKLIHDGLAQGSKGDDLIDEQAVKIARIIVEISHELTALYATDNARK